MRNLRLAGKVFLSLALASLFLYFFDPVLAAAFQQPLTNPQFAASPAGTVWRVMEVFSDWNGEIVILWIGYFLWLIRDDR